jgi:mono/diheme cytochrome c family protein
MQALRGKWSSVGLFGVLLTVAVLSCTQEQYPAALWEAQHPSPDAGTAAMSSAGSCRPITAQPLPQRLEAMSSAGGSTVTVTTFDLYQSFASFCHPCHTSGSDGSFQISDPSDFQNLSPSLAGGMYTRMTSTENPPSGNVSDPNDPMPPYGQGGAPFSSQSQTYQFAQFLHEWLSLGQPASFLWPPADGGAAASTGGDGGGSGGPSLTLTTAVGNAMTNLGSCLPDAALVQSPVPPLALQLDAMFASAQAVAPGPGVPLAQVIGLPEHLSQTDFFTFDTSVLAQYRVVAYQPTYPLWSDNSGKLRYVRVPIGQSITFNKATQEFDIPDNTRFYKTFMKKVIDTDGSIRWRKIETRLIVVRHDTPNPPNDLGGPFTQHALFGSYKFNSDESDATLEQLPLNDTLPFADDLFDYDVDEVEAPLVRAANPGTTPVETIAPFVAGVSRHYALPSSQRCQQCHMGSSSGTFILGFRPLQLNRRPAGEGGTYIEPEQGPPTPDELSQLQRFIDYGILTGLTPSDILPLEDSEGDRQPRNSYELFAQAYMAGNCAHCHNPRGYPSVQFPILSTILNFLPGQGPGQGVFQFPLEQYSPRITRGAGGNVEVPYITPSLMDVSESPNYVPQEGIMYAPWRSVIYRNVDTPFTYTSRDQGLFPHMPMNTAGYDCRTKQILSDWMVSIPAVRKHPEIPEYALLGVDPQVDDTPQPYVEVPPGAPGYNDAVAEAQARLAVLHSGINPAVPGYPVYSRYSDCVDTTDILDPTVAEYPVCFEIPPVALGGDPRTQRSGAISLKALNSENTPNHAHWVVTDLSQPPPPWEPRRSDWATVLIDQQIPAPPTVLLPLEADECVDSNASSSPFSDQITAVSYLQDAGLIDPATQSPYAFFTERFPMGLWQEPVGGGCDYSEQPTVGDYLSPDAGVNAPLGGNPPQWIATANPPLDPNTPVYAELPGAAVFNQICINCHGPLADGTGRLAANLATITGGKSLVADLRDGLFGPVNAPGQNMQTASDGFGVVPAGLDAGAATIDAWAALTTQGRGARYMAWMGLGGTNAQIPVAILGIVANTTVFGVTPKINIATFSANMLAVAKQTCYQVLMPVPANGGTIDTSGGSKFNGRVPQWFPPQNAPALVTSSGHAEVWERICTLNNPPPIVAVDDAYDVYTYGDYFPPTVCSSTSTTGPDGGLPNCYPVGAPIGNDLGQIELVAESGISPTNLHPWCIRGSLATPAQLQTGPICPPYIDNGSPNQGIGRNLYVDNPYGCTNGCWANLAATGQIDPGYNWAIRGAINAGFAVFEYLQTVEQDPTQRLPAYTSCPALADAGTP